MLVYARSAIKTYHAEDGSGVGAAVIAGASLVFSFFPPLLSPLQATTRSPSSSRSSLTLFSPSSLPRLPLRRRPPPPLVLPFLPLSPARPQP